MHAIAGAAEKARMGGAFPRLELAASSGQLVTIGELGRAPISLAAECARAARVSRAFGECPRTRRRS
jgi:hypothetical protein